MADIIIAGAGLTGLSAAYHLEQLGFHNYKLFEKESTVGGLCRSISDNGFTFDYTGHLLHASDQYFKQLLESIVGIENFYAIKRRSFVYSHETYTKYPFQINLYGLTPAIIAECIEGFVTRVHTRKKPRSFYQWVLRHFGKGLGKHFFFPFEQKKISFDVKRMTPTWTGRFVPKTSLEQMINGALHHPTHEEIGYNSQFYYPKVGGINYWVTQLAEKIKNPIMSSQEIVSVDLEHKTVLFSNGHHEPFKYLISTLPLNQLLASLRESSRSNLGSTAHKLLCNSVINFNIGVDYPDLSDKHWIYYPERQYPFYRIGFAYNFSPALVPTGCSSLYGEFSYIKQKTKNIPTLTQNAIAAAKKLLNIADARIIMQKCLNIEYAYVIYDEWRDKYVPMILNKLQDKHVYSTGRYGGWKYASMQEAVLDGKQVAEQLVEKCS